MKMTAESLLAKHFAVVARASSVTLAENGNVRSGGAWIKTTGTGVAARLTVSAYGGEDAPRKL